MPGRMPSASGIWRALECPASAVLPQVQRPAGEAAAFGTAIHRYLELAPKVGAEKALESVPEQWRGFCENVPLDKLPVKPGQAFQEVGFAIDLATGAAKEIGRGLSHDNCPHGTFVREVVGIADVVATVGPRAGLVGDYKSGAESHVPEPGVNPQMLTLGYAAAKVYGWDEVTLTIWFIREGAVFEKRATVSVLDLDAHLATLRQLERDIQTMDPTNPAMKEGPHCLWCSSFSVCPAKTRLASAIVLGEDPNGLTLQLDAQTLPAIWERVGQAQRILDAIKAACQGFAQANPVELPNGQVFGPHETSVERVQDGTLAWAYLLEKYGSEVAEAATTRHASKDSIREALRIPLKAVKEAGEKKSLAAMEREVLGALRDRGAVADSVTVKVEPHWPRK